MPHLVVQTESGPVTVMVLVHETVGRPVQFDEQGYRGTIVPVPGHGAMAVLMRAAGCGWQAVQRIAARVGASIDLDAVDIGPGRLRRPLDSDFAEQIDQPPRACRQPWDVRLRTERRPVPADRAARRAGAAPAPGA